MRHSDFLAFLLDPKQNHGSGDLFLRRVLQKALRAAAGAQSAVTLVDLDVWNLTDAQIEREWHNIDIFIRDNQHRLAVIVENKIDSGEHSGQLERYLAPVLERDHVLVNAVCPGWTATDMGRGGRSVHDGAASVVWAVRLPDVGPTGGFFRDGQPVAW